MQTQSAHCSLALYRPAYSLVDLEELDLELEGGVRGDDSALTGR